MARNLVVCFDGTSNEFGKVDTNVIRLVQVMERDQLLQHLYYDPGVGTLPEPGFVTSLGKKISDLMGLAFGAGLLWKVGEAYSYLMDTWEPGDQVFIFGFSRGAYSARVLAGLLHAFGLLAQGNQNMIPYMIRLFKRLRKERKDLNGEVGRWFKLCNDFRWTFAREIDSEDNQRRFPVHFVGVWDTVSSIGWIWNPDRFPYTAKNPSVAVVRHAVAIDERRAFFWQNLFSPAPGQDLREIWFAGSHCDVGGGYPEIETNKSGTEYVGSWRCAFHWMIEQAKIHGLLINEERLAEVLGRTPPCSTPWQERIHDSLVFPWTIGEVILKWVYNSTTKHSHLRCGKGQRRGILEGALIHRTALQRIQETIYAPANLSPEFLSRVKAITSLPDQLAYKASG